MDAFLNILKINDTLVYFVYGQVFFSLGLAIALHSRRRSELDLASHLTWLAAFGFAHGLTEWAHVFIPIQATYVPSGWIRVLGAAHIALVAISFFFLTWFGLLVATSDSGLRTAASIVLAALLAGWFVWAFPLALMPDPSAPFQAEAWARRLLALPGAGLAAVGLLREARSTASMKLPTIARDFRIAAVSFVAYGLLAGFVVPRQDPLVSQWPFYHHVVQLLGIPAPLLRSLAGLGIVFGIVRGLRIFDVETDRRLEASERARLEAAERARWLRQVITAQEEERRRVARELHDTTGQGLVAVIMGLDAARERVGRRSRGASAGLCEARDLAVRALEGTRELIMGLRPAVLDDLGLVPALRRFVEDLARKGTVEVTLDTNGVGRRLPADVEVVMFRILQESLTNVHRHSGAHHASVLLRATPTEVRAVVVDDGAGFDLAEATAHPESGRGLGLLGMKERAGLLGGQVSVETSIGQGTRVAVCIPVCGEQQVEVSFR